jgi:hypothetical protein
MNPYLEHPAVWVDFHDSLIPAIREQLNPQIRPAYLAKIEERTLAEAVDVERHPFLEIRDRENQSLVTVIEVLSPSNKNPGPDRQLYLAKRRQILAAGAHLVELDLLRGGPRLPLAGMPACDYCTIVSRREEQPQAGIWPTALRDALTPLPIPLRHPDPDAILDIKAVLENVYDAAGYEDYLYHREPQPPLNEEDATWARGLVSVRRT